MRHRVTTIALVAFLLAALAGPIALILRTDRSQAAFGDSETLGVNRLSSATVDVEIGNQSLEIRAEDLAPGDRAVGSIEIRNEGTLPIRFALVSEMSEDPLADWLAWDLWRGASPARCTQSPSPTDRLVAGVVWTSGSTPTPVLGDAAVGIDPGDQILQPGTSETICLAVTFDLDAPDTAQNRRLEQQFTVIAEQHTEGLDR